MKAAQSALLVLLALTALVAVASAYEPIADHKVPSAKVPAQAASRKLLQQGARATTSVKNAAQMGQRPDVLWAGYVVSPPFWVAGMKNLKADTPDIESERLFARVRQ